MTKPISHTAGGPLTDDDFETEAPAPGASDNKYDATAKDAFQLILERVRKQIEEM